ncbi:hypothetical protein BD309DRAFT_384589 [Dichomitus squalens]|nr:hypothetical protein BD309DRAFT_384589 [Dichomitus squalens]
MAGGGTTAAASNRRKNLAGPSSWAGLLANARVFALAIFASLGGFLSPPVPWQKKYGRGVFSSNAGVLQSLLKKVKVPAWGAVKASSGHETRVTSLLAQ